MATSARAAELLARRQAYNPYGTGARIRLLTPANNTIASIAKKTANNELDVMVKQYNAGQISNADFRAFLAKFKDNPGISEVDRADIALQIKDFDSRILGDTLTTAYKSAPDNSMQQLQGAQALANYFRQRAATFQPDTPAYIEAANNAATYDGHVMTIQKNITTKARQNQRYVLEQKVNQIPSGTSENASAKAEMWKQLYDQANADGDITAANQYAANYERELTNAETYSEKETSSANKKQLNDFINTTINEYHSGKISGDEAIAQLQQADEFAANIGDTSSQIRMQSLYQTISREIDKGITYTADGGFGIKSKGTGGTGELYLNPDGSVSYGGGTGGGSPRGTGIGTKITPGGVGQRSTGTTKTGFSNGNDKPKTFDQLDIEYQNQLNEANKALVDGKITPKQYQNSIMLLAKSRQVDLQNITTGLSGIVEADPTSKLGKKAQAALEKYDTELGNVTAEYNGIRSGNLVISMTNSSFTDPTGKKIGKPSLQLVPKSSVAKGVNVNGVYYNPSTENLVFGNVNDANQFIKNNKIPKGKAVRGEDGRYYVTDESGGTIQGDVLHVTDTAGNDVVYQDEGNGFLPIGVGPKTGALRARVIGAAESARKTGQEYKNEILNYSDINKFDFKTPVGIQNKPKPVDTEKMKAAGIDPTIVAPKAPIPPSVVAPQQPIAPSASSVGLPGSGPTLNQNGTFNPAPVKLSVAGTPPPAAAQFKQALNPTGKTPVKVAAPPISSQQAKKNADQATKNVLTNQYSVTNSLKKLANTLTFGLLKL